MLISSLNAFRASYDNLLKTFAQWYKKIRWNFVTPNEFPRTKSYL